jgi:uncharacterized membrane protein HdeD (DUF308 family)
MEAFIHRWWLYILRGLFAIAFGVLAIVRPGTALAGLVIAFGIYALADGIVDVLLAFTPASLHRGWTLFAGIVAIIIGVLTLRSPALTALALYVAMAVWAVIHGISELVVAIRLRRVVTGEAWLVAHGILTVIFGVLMFVLPAVGVAMLIGLIAAYAFIAGVVWIVFGAELARVNRALAHAHGA